MADTTTLPALTNPTSADKLNTTGVLHDIQHDDLNDLIEVWAAKVGIDSSAVATALDYLIQHGVHPKDFYFNGIISPTSLSANQNNYAPTNFATANVVRQNCSANVDITGLAGGASLQNGRFLLWFNISASNTQTLKNENGSSTAANRFSNGVDVVVPAGQSVLLWYDVTASRWKTVALPTTSGGAATTEAYLIAAASPPGTLPNSKAVGTTWGGDLAGTGTTFAAPIIKASHTDATIKTHHDPVHDMLDVALHQNFAWGTPVAVGVSNAPGSSTDFSRADHVHAGSAGGGGGGLASLITPVNVSNTTSDVLILTYTLAANELAIGTVLRFTAGWVMTNTSGTNRSITIKIKLGGTTIWTTNSGLNTGVSNRHTDMRMDTTLITIGASSTMRTRSFISRDTASPDVQMDITNVTGPSTTVTRAIEIYATFPAAAVTLLADFYSATIEKAKA